MIIWSGRKNIKYRLGRGPGAGALGSLEELASRDTPPCYAGLLFGVSLFTYPIKTNHHKPWVLYCCIILGSHCARARGPNESFPRNKKKVDLKYEILT